MRSLLRSTRALVAAMGFLLTTVATAGGQAVPTASGPGGYLSLGGGLSFFQADYGGQKLAGGFVYADSNPQWRVGLEGEARYLRLHNFEQVTETNYVGGLRVQLLHPRRYQPYVKFLAGMGRVTLPFGYAHGAFLDYVPGAGLDLAITPSVTLRAVDVEYQHWPRFTFGALSPYGVSMGLSVRLNPITRFPKGSRIR